MSFLDAMRVLVSGGTISERDLSEDVKLALWVGVKRGELVRRPLAVCAQNPLIRFYQ